MIGQAEGYRQTDRTAADDRNCMSLRLDAVFKLRHLGSVFFCSEGIGFEFHRLLLNEFLNEVRLATMVCLSLVAGHFVIV
ncbi:hypothetical protein AWB67_06383 [Caballeronia terrestris]|uniref:Uncharacterized protein n=1 Tax=Caballeronia terrestris TaxID=1226301 RepID=A0A158KQG1_9BURK|nr:hypothetical protein AWB67_06383 [Caballeronia terrestris]